MPSPEATIEEPVFIAPQDDAGRAQLARSSRYNPDFASRQRLYAASEYSSDPFDEATLEELIDSFSPDTKGEGVTDQEPVDAGADRVLAKELSPVETQPQPRHFLRRAFGAARTILGRTGHAVENQVQERTGWFRKAVAVGIGGAALYAAALGVTGSANTGEINPVREGLTPAAADVTTASTDQTATTQVRPVLTIEASNFIQYVHDTDVFVHQANPNATQADVDQTITDNFAALNQYLAEHPDLGVPQSS